MWATLTGKPILSTAKKCLLAVTVFGNAFYSAIGQSTTFVDPGPQGNMCGKGLISDLNRTIEEQDPALLYIHVPFVSDNENSKGYDNLKSFAKDQMDSGRTCIIADSRHTDRWKDLEPQYCRGDLAFHWNDSGISNELIEWAKRQDNEDCPRSVDDLTEVPFADVLAGLAETHHLDKCVDAAFAGTEEAAAETEPPIIDAVLGPDDRASADPAELHDDEQDLLEKIPLPGNPTNEAKRKKLWLSRPRRAPYQASALKFQAFTKECIGTDAESSKGPEGIY